MHHPFMTLIVPASILIPIGMALYKYKQVPASMRIVLYFLLVSVLVYAVSISMAVRHMNNLWVVHADTILESLFLFWFFHAITPPGTGRKVIALLLVLFPVFCLINLFFIQGIYRYNTYSRPVEAMLLVGLCMYYFWRTGNKTEEGPWMSQPLNWMVSGILLYFASAFCLFLCSNLVLGKHRLGSETIMVLWNIHAGLTMTMYLLFTIGFSQCKT
ncbi:MAG TPA: hypothetical protein VL832_14715 [Puia sp.]|nr:hypothetical protein [Puia sp.]